MILFKNEFWSLQARDAGKIILFDCLALAIVFFVPKIGEILQLPFYMIEPMRLMVIISIAHFKRFNAFLLALTLPLFSWIVSGHPEFYKMLVMTCEIMVNVFLFYFLIHKFGSVFLSMIIAIIVSKVLCYTLYLVFFSIMFIKEEAQPSFLIAQLITTLVFSTYVFFIYRKRSHLF